MPFDFPASPSEGATYTPVGGPTYIFNSPKWVVQGTASSSSSPTGPAGGALAGTYPNPGLAVPYPTTLPPTGAAGGDLSGTYPNPTAIKASGAFAVTGALTGTTARMGYGIGVPITTSGTVVTPAVQVASTAIDGYSALRYGGGNGATLTFAKSGSTTLGTQALVSSGTSAGKISFNGSNGTNFIEAAYIEGAIDSAGTPGVASMPGRVSIAVSPDGSATPAEALRIDSFKSVFLYGQLNGTTATFTSGAPGAKVLAVTGTTTSAAQDYFDVKLLDATGGGGSAMRVLGGPTGINPLYQVDRAGDTQVAGWHRALSLSPLVTNGADYFGYMLGDGAGGNIGMFAGSGDPHFSTFGAKGAIYLDALGAIPWYNVDGGTTWAKVGTGSGGASLTISDTPPGSPTVGAMWWNSVLGTLMVYYQDPNTSQWVPATPTASGGSGAQIQMVSVETGAVATGTTVIPVDDTIPQITEGDQYMTCSITPKSATSKLIIEIVLTGSCSVANHLIVALFQDSTANALAAVEQYMATPTGCMPVSFRHIMTSGTTSATTFKVRAGGSNAGTTTFNGAGGVREFGGVMASSIVIREVAP